VRLDLFLKSSRLILRRSLAQDFCDAGRVKLNGANAKSSKEVKVGDVIEIRKGDKRTTVKVLAVPTRKQVSKEEAGLLVEPIGESRDEQT
jgi:ribosomal 50S subunit-recycling heat shock protein